MAMENPFSFLGTVFLTILFVAVTVMGTPSIPNTAKTTALADGPTYADPVAFFAATPAGEPAAAAFSHQMAGGSCGACAAIFENTGPDLFAGSFDKAMPGNDGQFAAFAAPPPQQPPRT